MRVPDTQKGNIAERLLRWDVGFQRRLGVVATGAAGLLAIAGLPVAATWTAIFAGGNFAAAEIEKRVVDGMEKGQKKRVERHIGNLATKTA